jgi:transposase
MDELTHIGLDVHKDTIAVAVLRSGATTCDERVIPNTPEAVRKLFARYPDRSVLRTCYEAGPTGHDTHRLISSLGIACDVIAPSLIPRRSGVRVKTDRSDARNLARLHRAGELTAVRVPMPAEEALRDLVRAREDLKNDRRIARQRIRSFLLRYGKRYPTLGASAARAAESQLPLTADASAGSACSMRPHRMADYSCAINSQTVGSASKIVPRAIDTKPRSCSRTSLEATSRVSASSRWLSSSRRTASRSIFSVTAV